MASLAANVARRFVARAQLVTLLKGIEHLIRSEKWDKAEDEFRAFGKLLGVFFLGGDRLSIRTEWLSGADDDDKKFFIEFARKLQEVFNAVYGTQHHPDLYPTGQRWFDSWFRQLYQDLPAVQEMMRDESDEFKHGPFRIIPLKGVSDTAEAVATLDKASDLIRRKFPQVLYGKVYIRKDLRPKGTYDPRPGSGGMVAGAYAHATDTITLSMYATPERNSLMTLIHEFGHRYGEKFLKGDTRDKFRQLHEKGEMIAFTPAERQKAADEYMTLYELHQREEYPDDPDTILSPRSREYSELTPREVQRQKQIPLRRKFVDEGDNSVWQALHDAIAMKNVSGDVEFPAREDQRGVYASDYGETSWEENFAESFLHFVIGKALPKPLQQFMESL
jgi:hypothetical protein